MISLDFGQQHLALFCKTRVDLLDAIYLYLEIRELRSRLWEDGIFDMIQFLFTWYVIGPNLRSEIGEGHIVFLGENSVKENI